MKKSVVILYLFIFLISFSEEKGRQLTVNIEGLRNNKGQLLITIYNSKEGFPMNPDKALLKKELKITDKKDVKIILKDFDYGEYALSLFHDEDLNKKMSFNFIGIPKEGYGVSNNLKNKFSPPKYEEAKFVFNIENTEINISMNYILK